VAQRKEMSQITKTAGERKGRSPNEWRIVAVVPANMATMTGGIR
jgi:hypothetical protein